MELILWRHAEAEDGFPDMERRLTAKGERQAEKIADFLRSRLPDPTRIMASPAVRTQQTARALSRKFETEAAVGPGSDARAVLKATGWPHAKGCVLVVGHQPYLGEIAAMLLAGEGLPFTVKKGAIWWLSQRGGDAVSLRLCISPDLV